MVGRNLLAETDLATAQIRFSCGEQYARFGAECGHTEVVRIVALFGLLTLV